MGGGFGGGGSGAGRVLREKSTKIGSVVAEAAHDSATGLGEVDVEESAKDFEKVIATPEASEEIDLDRIWRTLDRSLLMLALGAKAKDIKGLPKKGIDGKSFVFEGTVEVTVLWDSSCDEAEARKVMAAAGLSIQGASQSGSVVVGRIGIAKLLELSQTTCVRRIVPTSAR